MRISNTELYETDEVVAKYGTNATRNRCLNNAEKIFVDKYDVKDKNILVLGAGIGRVPANLLLFGNKVTGIELSEKLFELSKITFPVQDFARLRFEHGNAIDLNLLESDSFDVVFFPQNGIDYIEAVKDRERALNEMARVCKKGGLVAFSSLNLIAYCISYKLPWHQKTIKNLFANYMYREEHVIGGGYRYMSKPGYLIEWTQKVTNLEFVGFTADVRNGIDARISKSLKLSSLIFPWLNYIFKN